MEITDPKSPDYQAKVAWIKTLKRGDSITLFGGQQLQIKELTFYTRPIYPGFLFTLFNLTMFLPKTWSWMFSALNKITFFLEEGWILCCNLFGYVEILDCTVIDHQGLKHSVLMCSRPTDTSLPKEEALLLDEDVEVIQRWGK